jgi:hypothetical protein
MALGLAVALLPDTAGADPKTGLRWVGDARAAVSVEGGFLAGPALRFRYGSRLGRWPKADTLADVALGSWAGAEISAGLLVGAPEPESHGAIVLLGFRPWLSRRQADWFLRTERWSVLGALLPEVGVTFGFRRVPRLHLGWELPFGSRHVHVVPGVVWISPGERLPLFFTAAFRVTM